MAGQEGAAGASGGNPRSATPKAANPLAPKEKFGVTLTVWHSATLNVSSILSHRSGFGTAPVKIAEQFPKKATRRRPEMIGSHQAFFAYVIANRRSLAHKAWCVQDGVLARHGVCLT
jgi:hypothetical protein